MKKALSFIAMAGVVMLFACSPEANEQLSSQRYKAGKLVNANTQDVASAKKSGNFLSNDAPVEKTVIVQDPLRNALSANAEEIRTAPSSQPVASVNAVKVTNRRSVKASSSAVNASQGKETASVFERSTVKKQAKGIFSRIAAASDVPQWLSAVLCIILPPLAVYFHSGIGTEFWISILLTILFWIPGVIYAFIVCFG